MQKLKICQLCNVDFTLFRFLLPLIDAQVKAGHEVISICSNGEKVTFLKQKGYKIKTMSISRSMNPIKFFLSVWSLYKILSSEKFDLIHVHTPIASLIGRVAAKLAGVKKIAYTAHGFYFHENMPAFERYFHILIEKIAGLFTDILFTQSTEDAQTAKKLNIVPSDCVFPIGNGVDVNRFNPNKYNVRKKIRDDYSIPESAFVICMIGRLVEEKGVIDFLNAAELLIKNEPNTWFLLVGERLKSDRGKFINEKINVGKLNLRNQLILLGMREDIPEILSSSDLFTLPSWREGMPRSIIEAMMMALPVVATNIRGSREEVIDKETGLLVPTKNPQKLSDAFEKIIKNPKLARKMGCSGRDKALSLFDERKVINLQLNIIEKIFEEIS